MAIDPRHLPVFVLTHGRCGSTWLQRILNLHPKLTIWGEHHGLLTRLCQALVEYEDAEARLGKARAHPALRSHLIGPLDDPDRKIEWVVPFSPTDLRVRLREMLDALFARDLPPDVRWGFKEIRYESLLVPRVLAEIYAGARFVILRRAWPELLRSMLEAWAPLHGGGHPQGAHRRAIHESSFAHVKAQETTFAALEAEIPERTVSLSYEQLVGDYEATVTRVFAALDLDLDAVDPEMLARLKRTNPDQGAPAYADAADEVARFLAERD